MLIKTKFNVGDLVWYMSDITPIKVCVEKITITVYKETGISYTITISSGLRIDESKLFATKEELLNSL